MVARKRPPRYYLLLAAAAFLIAGISFSGIVLKGDLAGRLIFGSVWLLICIGWMGRFFQARRVEKTDEIQHPRRAEQ